MPSLLEQLDNDSILLLYLTGELSAREAGDVERMLANDSKLRAKLDELRSAYDATRIAIDQADASERLSMPAGTAARRVGQAVRGWHARRLADPGRAGMAATGGRRLRFPLWSYPVAAAAAVILGAVSWWGFQSDGGIRQKLDPLNPGIIVIETDSPGGGGSGSPENEPAGGLAANDDGIERTWESYSAVSQSAADADLDAAEDELFAMLQPTDADGSAAELFLTGDAGDTGDTDEQ